VLGLLIERPAYQYQLTSRMEQRMGPGWGELSGQVSQAVKSLEEADLIRRVDPGEDGSDTPTFYEVTKAGVSEFACFLKEDLRVKLQRRPIQVQLAFAGKAHLPDVLDRLDAYEGDCARLLGEVMGIYNQTAPQHGYLLRADNLLLRLSLGADLAHLEAELGWARQARELIEWLIRQEDAVWPSSSGSAPEQQARATLFTRLAGRSEKPTIGEANEGE
jgi:DNA-binding PadR family transcriptional regulator